MHDLVKKDAMIEFQSPVRGHEIMDICKISEGKKVGEIKKVIEEAILDGKIDNSYDAAKDYLLEIKDKIIQ